MLKVLASLESDLSLSQWQEFMTSQGWRVSNTEAGLRMQKLSLDLAMEGDGFTLLHGTIKVLEQDVTRIKELLKDRAQLLQLDVFEEDGRMIKRITHL